jgi:hypothetical protein
MDILSIQGLTEKLQAREIQGDVGAQALFSKMFLDIPKKEKEDLEEEIEVALTDQMVDRMKRTGRLV